MFDLDSFIAECRTALHHNASHKTVCEVVACALSGPSAAALAALGEPPRGEIQKLHNAALHVYGGDFFAPPHSAWDPETLTERPYDMAKTLVRGNQRPLGQPDKAEFSSENSAPII